ncbi:hypothetical protein GCM10009714_31960 [Microlunatus capsulatus]
MLLAVGLLLPGARPQLHHGRGRGGEGAQDVLAVLPRGRHPGLGGEDQRGVGSLGRVDDGQRPRGQEGQPGQPEAELGGDPVRRPQERDPLAVAVHEEEVAAAAERDRARRGGDADPRQPRQQDRAAGAAQHRQGRQPRDHGPGAGQQDDVGALPQQQRGEGGQAEGLHRRRRVPARPAGRRHLRR